MQSCGMGVVKRLNGERVNIERRPLWSQNREPPPVKSKLQSNPLNSTQYSHQTRGLQDQTKQIIWDANTSCKIRIANQSLHFSSTGFILSNFAIQWLIVLWTLQSPMLVRTGQQRWSELFFAWLNIAHLHNAPRSGMGKSWQCTTVSAMRRIATVQRQKVHSSERKV